MSRSKRNHRTTATPKTQGVVLPLWKKMLFGAVVCLLFLTALEAFLALVGVKVSLYQRDPYVGFARNVPHFVPDPAASEPGTLVTAENKRRVLNLQRFTARKPKGTYRIFCLGGSTTYGHPYSDSTSFCGWLRAMLPQADPSRRWELINAGGISYASYREALLMEELAGYEPDLFIVLSAHNEFLEQRTYADLIAVPETVRGLGAVLARTRIFSVMKNGADRMRGHSPVASGSTNWLAENPEAILDRTVGPQSYHRDDAQQKKITDHYRFNLARMADIAKSAGARVIFINPASNLRSCDPFKSEHQAGLGAGMLDRWNQRIGQALEARGNQRFAEALKAVDEAATLDDRYADLHYLRGHLLWDLDRFSEARVAFMRARDEDVCPLRAPGALLDATVEVARQRGVPLVDFVQLVEGRSLNRIPGDDWFLDHVHPTIEGHRLLALELMRVMEKEGICHPAPSWNEAAQQAIRRTVESQLTEKDQAVALITLAKVLAWAGKGADAYRVSLRAEKLAPDDATVQFELGKNASHIGRRDEAIRSLQKAVATNPRFVEAHSLLGTQLMEAGQVDEALRQCREAASLRPEDPLVLLNLGTMLQRSGRNPEAEAVFRQALKLSPGYAEAHNNLGWLLKGRGAFDEAVERFRDAVRLRPGSVSPTLGLTWILAAHPEAGRRDPQEAIRLGERLAEQSSYQNWMSLDALAVAYAAAGRFPDAVKAESRALELARAANQPAATNAAARLALFQQNRAFVETAGGR